MTSADSSLPATGLPVEAKVHWIDRLDVWLERMGERLNPILVKEARQALKSRQFLVTFSLLLICGWGWSFIGVASHGASIYYAATGGPMLIGYFFVLAVPMLVIVPFTAFRSLAAEREDGTYELLSISTLSSRQIVTGKLGSALLQMLVYYSALSPCVAFTYLLRGIDIFSIMFVLVYTFLISLVLSAISLLVATMSTSKTWQVLTSVLIVVGLIAAAITWMVFVVEVVIDNHMSFDEPMFVAINLSIISGAVSYFVLFIFAAAAQLSFSSDNRSTKLRIILLAQQILLVGWCVYFWVVSREDGVIMVMCILAAIHWTLAGTFLTGELAQLSPRVRRALPQSVFGRLMLTWFNPGSGTGYIFAVVNLTSIFVLTILLYHGAKTFSADHVQRWHTEIWHSTWLMICYMAGYLGVGRLFTLLLRRRYYINVTVTFLFQVAIIAFGALIPTVLQFLVLDFSNTYTELQATNWLWTLAECLDDDLPHEIIAGVPLVTVIVTAGAAVIFFTNVVLASREVEQVRQAAPERVLQDEAELHPPVAEPPLNPWANPEPPAESGPD